MSDLCRQSRNARSPFRNVVSRHRFAISADVRNSGGTVTEPGSSLAGHRYRSVPERVTNRPPPRAPVAFRTALHLVTPHAGRERVLSSETGNAPPSFLIVAACVEARGIGR